MSGLWWWRNDRLSTPPTSVPHLQVSHLREIGHDVTMNKVETRVSTDGLTRCTSCRRHVHAGETPSATACPFCERGTPSLRRGGLLAASLFAMACGGAEPAPQQTPPSTVEAEPADEAGDEPGDEPGNEEADSFENDPAPESPPVDIYGMPPTRE